MKRAFTTLVLMAAIAAPAAPALAKGPSHCPPGLAKKTPACIPPGLAKKQHQDDDHYDDDHYRQYRRYDGDDYGDYRRGDRIPDLYERILTPRDYGLPESEAEAETDYIIVDDVIFEVSKETREVIDLYRAVGAILN